MFKENAEMLKSLSALFADASPLVAAPILLLLLLQLMTELANTTITISDREARVRVFYEIAIILFFS